MGPSSGIPIEVGMIDCIFCNRSATCCLAQYTSVSSLNTMVTKESPNLEKLLISVIPLILLVACSMGKVIKRSISVAPKEGATVII